MGYPNMNCMQITLYVHHMEVDALFDFINERTNRLPEYWINPKDLPGTISGGFLEINVNYEVYTRIRGTKEHSTWMEL